jgi:hypothetical protein
MFDQIKIDWRLKEQPTREKSIFIFLISICCLFMVSDNTEAQGTDNEILNKQEILDRHSWIDNRDWDWYKEKIPFFESPETVIDATYFYRWEVMTKHLIYGSPETGYTFTEFLDRPSWSGKYGSISCPLGHQFYEIRWLKDRRIIHDFANYWFETPGAEPRSYSNWYGDSMWEIYKVWQDENFVAMVYPHMQQQYRGWMEEHFDPEHQMFMWDGMHDGMETNINSRQTEDWFSGGDGYRPTLNSYLYADLKALSNAAALLGDNEKSEDYGQKARNLKQRLQEELWDPDRQFFFHQWSEDKRDGIKAKTLTYETGKYAGSSHGRELIGYVPWQFNLPDPEYSEAWKFMMDEDYFWSDYGPTVTEQGDPLFQVSPNCCVWSGNSWPYATTQTLVAMANLLNNYDQNYIDKDDYFEVLRTYSRMQQLNGRPYVAEAANPFTGSWDGHNHFYHSEHYSHSGYTDLIITGLAGLRPREDNTVEINPLIPDDWDYFALDDLSYHGHSVSIVWDRNGDRYGKGEGLMLFVDGEKADSSKTVQKLTTKIDSAPAYNEPKREHNFAVNNEKQFYPHISVSYSNPQHLPYYAVDGNYWYHETPPNRWTTEGSDNKEEWVTIDFGVERPINRIELYFLDDEQDIGAPAEYKLDFWDGRQWAAVPGQQREFADPIGHRPNTVKFEELSTSKIRVTMQPKPNSDVGLTEIEAWGNTTLPLAKPEDKASNLAYREDGEEYPKLSASYTFEYDQLSEINDMKTVLLTRSANRWTAFESPNESDWVEVDFGERKGVSRFDLYLYGDDNRVKAPKSYTIEYWDDNQWKKVNRKSMIPETPEAMALNKVVVEPVETSKIRIHFEHPLPDFAGVTELMIWESELVE